MLGGENFQVASTSMILPSRRRCRLAIASAFASTHLLLASAGQTTYAVQPILDDTDDDDIIFVQGRVTLQSPNLLDDIVASVSDKVNGSSYALYVTARPSIPDNVPTVILDSSRGKPPPVLSARYPNPSFPFNFVLNARDFTAEGASEIVNGDSACNKRSGLWWGGEDLILSARLDTDGIASTRDPTDLVGRGVFRALTNDSPTSNAMSALHDKYNRDGVWIMIILLAFQHFD